MCAVRYTQRSLPDDSFEVWINSLTRPTGLLNPTIAISLILKARLMLASGSLWQFAGPFPFRH